MTEQQAMRHAHALLPLPRQLLGCGNCSGHGISTVPCDACLLLLQARPLTRFGRWVQVHGLNPEMIATACVLSLSAPVALTTCRLPPLL